MLHVTALYAGILGLLAVALSLAVGKLRGETKIPIGDGGNPDLLLAMRRQANFLENVPLLLVLFGVLELNGVGAVALHSMGSVLVVARIAHAVGLKGDTIQ